MTQVLWCTPLLSDSREESTYLLDLWGGISSTDSKRLLAAWARAGYYDIKPCIPNKIAGCYSVGIVLKPTRLLKAACGVVLALALSALAWRALRRPVFDKRIYTIGWMLSPPFQTRGENDQPAGLAIDLVREAARRRGIRLRWVHWRDSSESALRKMAVDLWPLITISPERLKSFHISEPYLESEYCLLVRADSPHYKVQDLAKSTIGFSNPTSDSRHLHGRLPDARPLSQPLIRGVMEDVCQQRSDAAFMDSYTAIAALLDPRACAGNALRFRAAPVKKLGKIQASKYGGTPRRQDAKKTKKNFLAVFFAAQRLCERCFLSQLLGPETAAARF
jgi:ABC-type amino acid transport substrate-binding protein